MKKCSFCGLSTNDGKTVFTLSHDILDFLGIRSECKEHYKNICEDHFSQDDIKIGPKRKKLKAGALPDSFENAINIKVEHSYAKEPIHADQAVSLEAESHSASEKQSKSSLLSHSSQGSIGSLWEPDESDLLDHEEEVEQEAEEGQDERQGKVGGLGYVLASVTGILALLSICRVPGCGEMVPESNIEVTRNGAVLHYKMTCVKGCKSNYSTSESFASGKGKGRKMEKLNIVLSYWILLCGLAFKPMKEFFKVLKVPMVEENTHYRYLSSLLYPVIYTYWLVHQSMVLDEIRQMQETAETTGTAMNSAFSGDARFDSPGFTAMFATLFVISINSGKCVVAMVVNKRQTGNNSPVMETSATRAALNFLAQSGVKIDHYVTDRSISVRSLLQDEFHWIRHQFDVWHFCKSISKALFAASKLKTCKIITKWHSSIINQIWWAIASSIGDSELAKEKIVSILSHISGQHFFPTNKKFKQCAHSNLDNNRDKEYVKPGSLAMKKIRAAIFGKGGQNLKDLENMDCFLHTGSIESLNSMATLKYLSKTYSYSQVSMIIRSVLAAMDMNYSLERSQKVTKAGKLMYKIQCDRSGKNWRIRPIMEEKDYQWREELLELVLHQAQLGEVPDISYPVDDEIEQPKCPFSKDDLISSHQSRMLLKPLDESLE